MANTILVRISSRRCSHARLNMHHCFSKKYKLIRNNLIKILVTHESGVPNNLGCQRLDTKSLANVMLVNARSMYDKLNELEILVDNR
jgi:DTW domain-containing protein YfiP